MRWGVCALVLLLWVHVVQAAIAHVQTQNNWATAVTSVGVTATVTAGNLAIVHIIIERETTPGSHTLTTNQSDSCTNHIDYDPGNSRPVIEQWSCHNLVGGSTTFTFSLGGGAGARDLLIFLTEVSGMATSSEFDVSATNECLTATTCASGTTAATAQADELAMTALGIPSSRTITPDGAYTTPTNGDKSTSCGSACGSVSYKILAATGTQSATWTLDSSNTMETAIGTYKGAAAAATGKRRRVMTQ